MKTSSLTLVLASVWLISACGARTSEDELLGYQRPVQGGSGGKTGAGGGVSAGGTFGAGGVPPASGGSTPASGGTPGAGGGATGGLPGTGGAAGGTGGAFPGNLCCEEHEEAGCNITFIEECVCALDDYCCENSWDRRCVNTANDSCLGGCFVTGTGGGASGGAPSAGGSGGGSGGSDISSGGSGSGGAPAANCCEVHDAAGCQNMSITSCVCGFDSFCCENSWDNYCVEEAQRYCQADCGGGSGGAPSGTGGANFCDFTGECGSCTCGSCKDEMAGCQNDSGCLSIAWCVQGSSCLPFDCYRPEHCKDVIDKAGGLTGDAAVLALKLSSCVINANCPCQ